MIGTFPRGTPGAPLGRLSAVLLALACTGALATACSPDRHPAAPNPPGAPPPAAPLAGPPAAPPAPGPTPGVPRRVLAVADPPRASVPAPSPAPAGRGPDRPAGSAPAPRSAAPRKAHPTPGRPSAGSPGLCALGEQYGGWAPGSSQDDSCRAVYG
ncbi:hypothetical protein ABUW04_24120 [Streptacidiphilus sp. N1-10]|uniref:Lipoprotein n=1 Tax=Streptacidiphilus jeojiensis TaxID=3229225 RepID=A0ABV6XSV2_9ACTN